MGNTEETVALLEAIVETGPDGIVVLDRSSRVVRCNQRFLQLFGVTAGQVVGRSSDEIVALLKQGGQPDPGGLAGELFSGVGGLVIERCSAPLTGSNGLAAQLDTYRDVTEWRRHLQEARTERVLLETAQEIAHIGSWTWEEGPAQTSLHCSTEAARIFGIGPEQFPVTPEDLLVLVYADDRDAVRRATAAASAAGDAHEIEHRILRRDNDLRWLHVKARVIRDDQGRAMRMVGTVQDITNRRLLEEQLRQSQKLEAIGRLAGGVAHDLNNALTAIVGYTELSLCEIADTHPAWPDVREIRRAAERAEAVTRQLLSFSRRQRFQPRVFHLSQTIESLRRMLEQLIRGGIEMDITVDEALPAIYGDPGQIQQALINLAMNARDAMTDGGRLSIRGRLVRFDQEAALTPGPMPAGEYVELSVSDTGLGMSAETQAHMFEPFFTTKEIGKGTGLGLPMVYGAVQQSGGFIFVDSALGGGSTFRVYFPAAAAAVPDDSASAAINPAAATVLVAETEASVRALVTAALSSHGYRVLQAESAAEALRIASEETDQIDLLLTDASMPGMNGAELANEIVGRRGSLHVVIMSGYTADSLNVAGLAQPIAFLPKPFNPYDLWQKVREVLARPGGGGTKN